VRKRKDHFIFTIESTGVLEPPELFKRALAILASKADKLAQRL
jgi:DNA-directed RNA polymerase I and III subunit RPAC1